MRCRPAVLPTALLVLCVVVAGCAGTVGVAPADPSTSTPRATFADPAGDPLGWEAGYWYDEPVPVDGSTALTRRERAAVVARAMARVERIRGLEFASTVPVDVVARDAGVVPGAAGANATAWEEVVWEALLLVGEDRTVDRALGSRFAGSVHGRYLPDEERIVVVREGSGSLDRRTLVHELVHALQDQRFGVGSLPPAPTRDARLARAALIEGDAGYVADRYDRRCRAAWSCLPRTTGAPGVGRDGLALAVTYPYGDGPAFVHRLRRRGGWTAVDAAYADPPASTAQVIHPERYPDRPPVQVRIPDRSAADWERFDRSPPGTTVGEASLFATLSANGAVDRVGPTASTRPHRAVDYTHPLTTGWVGDRIVPYRDRSGADARYGYVFRTEWARAADAAAFADAYRGLLRTRRGAERRGADVLVVPAGPYADAFRVTRRGTTVTVVNAPTVAALDGIHD
jgi:hypothetical protein